MSDETRVAVVTGANRGMGLETCRQLAGRGMTVVLTSRDAAKGQKAAAALAADGVTVAHHQLDVTDVDSVKAFAEHLAKTYGRLDVLVNNAGAVFDPAKDEDASFFEADPEVLRRSFELNTLGAFHCCQALIPLMRKNGYGRVVNISTGMASLSGMNGLWPGYRISKTALNALTKLLSDELKDTNIKVNVVCPGSVRTAMGGEDAPRSVEEGVDTTIWLATMHDDGPSGGFFRDCKAIDW